MKKPHRGTAESDSLDDANGAERGFPFKSVLFGVALVLALVYTLYDARKSVTLIDAFEVPKSLADQGYSPEAVANQIVDEIYNIQRDVRTRATKGQVGLSSVSSLPDI
jgi:hypothetical protein